MKKRFISLCLTLALTAAPAGAAFSDISSGSLQQTASILGSLGIMQGTGNNRFEPNRPLTRAEFCKLAVTAMGIDDASPYASYTIFPDVHASHWAARYVNAALRHPDFKDNYIIRGYADGTFGPDRQLTYGEVCTMLLRMLGYKESDIGPFWPADYIAQANALGLTQGVSIKDAKTPVTRADAATMLLNTLGTSTRSDGQEGSPLISRVSSSTVENCILLETSETDSSLAADEALFYENGTLSARKTAGKLDRSLIGVYGTLVIGKKGDNVAVGVVPDTASRQETYEVVNAAADRIVTKTGAFRPNRTRRLIFRATALPRTASSNRWPRSGRPFCRVTRCTLTTTNTARLRCWLSCPARVFLTPTPSFTVLPPRQTSRANTRSSRMGLSSTPPA